MATDMFGNILSPEEEERLRLHQIRMGIEPAPVVTPSLYPNQAAPYGSFPYVDPTTPSIWESPLGVVPSAPQLAGPTVNKFTPQQLSTPIKDLQQQNIPSNVVPLTGGLAATDTTGGFMQNVLNAIIPTAQAKLPAYGKDIYTDQTSALPETTTDPRSFRFDDIFTSQEPTDTIAVKQAIADDSSIGRIMADVIAREADRTAAQNVDTFVDMPQETQATRWDMTKATAEATARNVAGKLGIDLGPMDTNMSEEGLEKVLEAAWENKQSYPNNEVALTTLQAGALGLNEQDESAYDTMIGALPASAITLSPAGLSFYDPKGFQIGSKAAVTD